MREKERGEEKEKERAKEKYAESKISVWERPSEKGQSEKDR